MPEYDRLMCQITARIDLTQQLLSIQTNQEPGMFDSLALSLFHYQCTYNRPYHAYVKSLGLTPDSISSWREIPAVPTSAFKLSEFPLICAESIQATFLTSGTTTETRGAHHFFDLSTYESTIDAGWPFPDLPTYFLSPSNLENPDSSLSHMFAHLNSGDDSHFLLHNSKFHLSALLQAIESGHPLFLMGTALAFLHLMETFGPLPLPSGSQILETGGYKGTSHSLAKPEFYFNLSSFFQTPVDQIHNEYGMTELSSQAYATGPDGRHRFPPWCRTRILNPDSNQEVAPGDTGYLVIHDLANRESVAALRTQDFAIRHDDDSFTLIGRDPGALPRGCSRTIDHALSS